MNVHAKQQKARIFMNGRSRAVRIPADFTLDVDEVVLRQEEDGTITIRPARKGGLLAVLENLQPLGDDEVMPDIEDYPPEPVELAFDDEE